MGEMIVRRVAGMNWKAKISLVLIFTLVFSTFMYQGWHSPRQTEAAATLIGAWTQAVNSSTANPSTSTSYTVPAGTRRLLVIAVTHEFGANQTANPTMTVSYGGQGLTLIAQGFDSTNRRQYAGLFYLNEAGIAAASGNQISVQISETPSATNNFNAWAATYGNVDQTTPITDFSSSSSNSASSLTFGKNVNIAEGDQLLYVADHATAATTASTPAAYTQRGSDTNSGHSSWVVTRDSTAAGTQNQTITFGATSTCALAVASLNANDPPALSVSEPNGTGDTVNAGQTYNITYTLSDPDEVVTAAFFYDNNGTGLDGTAITGACATAPEGTNVTCAWDTTGMTPGTYYVYGIASDGMAPQASAYSPGIITINPAPCVRNAPTVTMGPNGIVTQAGVKDYTISVTNNDTANCSSSTFTLGIGSETGNTASFVLPSAISPTTTGALAPGATYTGSTLSVTAQAAATIGHTLTTTVSATDGSNHAAQPGSGNVTTTVARSTLLHNSLNMTANYTTKNNYWNAQGGWGIAGGVYGEFTCETCHTKTTTNIKRVKTSITVPDTSKGNIPGSTVNLQSVSGTTNGFGDDQVARTSSTRVCEVCHTLTAYHKYNQTPVSLHENTATTPANYQDCINCHEHDKGFAAPGCIDCHATQQGSRAAVVGQFSSNSHHVQGVTLTNVHCYQCHWEANANGSMNTTYHLGWRNGLAGVSNSAVDLVVWNAATRPASYIAGTTAVQYIASPANRTEYADINTHCLGCHNDTNLNTQPFGDGMKTSQYSWDGSSVSNRYIQLGTTTWGKYPITTNAAQKNATKAYSAHGNAANNSRGWNTTNGYDGVIGNTSGGVNVLCIDCHNSHGSTVAGTTTSYASATTNGGILKDVTNGIGGYTTTYKPQDFAGSATKVAHKAGAALCFDCHMTQNAGTTPWGYQGTFGASQAIMGYTEKQWWAGAAGVNPAGAQQRYTYKNSIGSAGGHFGASSPMTTLVMGTIGGLCTPCHDPHGVTNNSAKIVTADKPYGVPLLKGTWMTSPYKEDAAPSATNEKRGGSASGPSAYTAASTPGYYIDQNTFENITTSVGTTGDWVWPGTNKLTQTAAQFGGLCLSCHPQTQLNPSTTNTTWTGMDRIHNTVKGWGGSGANAGNAIHAFSCSKCHTPHNSCLPRLMITNCIDYKHRGRVASGGTPGSSSKSGSRGAGQGRFPAGGGGAVNSNGSDRYTVPNGGFGAWFAGNGGVTTGKTTPALNQCHNVVNAGGTSHPTSQLWNAKTPW